MLMKYSGQKYFKHRLRVSIYAREIKGRGKLNLNYSSHFEYIDKVIQAYSIRSAFDCKELELL